MRLLVTGAAGFVAPYLIECALARGWQVKATDIRERRWPRWLPGGFNFEATDIVDAEAVARLAADVDVIVHLAGIVGPAPAVADAFRATRVNVLGSQAVFDAAAKRGIPVLNMSTATLYGRRSDLATLDETDRPDPVSHYDATKYMSEVMAGSYAKSFGLKVASLRTSFVYGQGHSTGEYFVDRVLRGEAVHLPIGGDNPCDFTYVADLAEGVARAVEHLPLPEPVYNLSGGRLLTRNDFIAVVRRALPAADITVGPGIDPKMHLRGPCAIERARRDFGFAPAHDLDAGVADWIRRERIDGAALGD